MTDLLRVATLLEAKFETQRRFLKGVVAFARVVSDWLIVRRTPEMYRTEGLRALVKEVNVDGIIGHFSTADLWVPICQGRLALNTSFMSRDCPLPRIGMDDRKVGRLAAGYYLDKGFRHFAVVQVGCHWFSVQRADSFASAVGEENVTRFYVDQCCENATATTESILLEKMVAFLCQLPSPCALLATNDIYGQFVGDAARMAGIAVPEQLAVLGVDDEELRCDSALPPMSSIRGPAEKVGYMMAARLDEAMRAGRPLEGGDTLLAPVGVTERQSTEVVAVGDAILARALELIRHHACDPIGVQQLVDMMTVSRRPLEQRFAKLLGRSPAQEIRRVQIQRARKLLTETSEPMSVVAGRCGFRDGNFFSRVFRKEVGVPPTDYRDQNGTSLVS